MAVRDDFETIAASNAVKFADTGQLDAFGRLRVSNPDTIFDSKQIYDNQPLFWDEAAVTDITSSHSANTASTTITYDGGVTGGTFTRQTFMWFNYQPGKSQQIMMTGILKESGGGTGVTRSIGTFNDDNGLFFSDIAGTVNVVRRTNVTGTPVDDAIPQSSWNHDKMDGTGPSGLTVDWSKTQIFLIDFEWLGVGRIRYCLIIGGVMRLVHEADLANIITEVYMSTPNLPLRYQMIAVGSSAASTMRAICATVISEGGEHSLGKLRHAGTRGASFSTSSDGTLYAVVGIKLKTTHLGAMVDIVNITLAEHAGNKTMEWIVMFNPTVAQTFVYSDVSNSCLQRALGAATNTVTGGVHQYGNFFNSSNKGGSSGENISNAIRLGSAIDGTRDSLVLCAGPVGSTNATVEGAITWREVP